MAYNFSSYFNKQALHDSIYGNTYDNFINQTTQAINNFITKNAQSRLELENYEKQIDYNIMQIDKDTQLQLNLATHKRKSANMSSNASKWWELQMGGKDGQNGILNNFGIGDDGKKANEMYQTAISGMKGAWGSGLAQSWGFETEEEFNRYLDEVFLPSLPSYDMSIKSITDNDIRIQSQNNVIDEINNASADSPTFEWFLNQSNNSLNANAVNDDTFIASTIISGSDNFFSKAIYNDAKTALTEANYLSRDEFVAQQQDSAQKLVEQLIGYFSDKGITLVPADISKINSIANEEYVKAKAEKLYDSVREQDINETAVDFQYALGKIENSTTTIDETELQIELGIINPDGSQAENLSAYRKAQYEANVGQMVSYHNYITKISNETHGAITDQSCSEYLLNAEELVFDEITSIDLGDYKILPNKEKQKIDGVDTSNQPITSDGKKTSAPRLSVGEQSGFVIDNGQYSSYNTHNKTNAENMLIGTGLYEDKNDIPPEVLLETCMAMDKALYNVTEDSKMAMWNRAISPAIKDEEAYAILKTMEAYNMFPPAKDGKIFDYYTAIEKRKSVPSPIVDLMSREDFKALLNGALAPFKDLDNSNYQHYTQQIKDAIIDELRPVVNSGKFDSDLLYDEAEKIVNNVKSKYENDMNANFELGTFVKNLKYFENRNTGKYIPLKSESSVQSNIKDLLAGESPYNLEEVLEWAGEIASGNLPLYSIAEELSTIKGLKENDRVEFKNIHDFETYMDNAIEKGDDKAIFLYNEFKMAFKMGNEAKMLQDTFLSSNTDTHLMFYTPDGRQGIYIPANGTYDDRIFISTSTGNGGAYMAYTGLSNDTREKLRYSLDNSLNYSEDRRTIYIDSSDTNNATHMSTIINNPPLHIKTDAYKPAYVGGTTKDLSAPVAASQQKKIRNEFSQAEYEDNYLNKNYLYYRMQDNMGYNLFMESAKMINSPRAYLAK